MFAPVYFAPVYYAKTFYTQGAATASRFVTSAQSTLNATSGGLTVAKLKIARGTTSKVVRVFVQNATSASGAGLTGLTNASGGLTAYYIAEGSAVTTAISLVAGTLGTWSSGGFVAVDATNMPGMYELGLPNAAIASGQSAVVFLQGATNMVPVVLEIELDAVNYQDAVRAGLTALPNVAQGAIGSIPVSISTDGRVQLSSTDETNLAAINTAVAKFTFDASNNVNSRPNAAAAQAFVDSIADLVIIEGAVTMRQMMRLFGAALAGPVSGAGTTTITLKSVAGNNGQTGTSKNRIVATVDSVGDRTAITYDLT